MSLNFEKLVNLLGSIRHRKNQPKKKTGRGYTKAPSSARVRKKNRKRGYAAGSRHRRKKKPRKRDR